MTKDLQNLVKSSWLWGIMRVALTNQKRGNVLTEQLQILFRVKIRLSVRLSMMMAYKQT